MGNKFLLLTLFIGTGSISFAAPQVDTSLSVPRQVIAKADGKIEGKYSFSDKKGNHLLILTRTAHSKSDGSIFVRLQAIQFLNMGQDWIEEWTIKDFLNCEGLDIDADFLTSLTSISDLDANGIDESTVAYRVACFGGLDPRPTKVIMREGTKKYAIRGESLMQIGGQPPYGGDFKADSTLDSIPIFRKYLLAIWKKAANIEIK